MSDIELNNQRKTFRQFLRAVFAFPFKVLWLLVKVAGVLLLAGVLTTVGYCVYRSGQPMMLPEARGMTYRQFFGERYKNWVALDRRKATAGIDKSGHACTYTELFFTIPNLIPRAAIGMTLASMFPDSDLARALKFGDSYFYRNIPAGSEPKLQNFLPLLWEAIERQSWTWWVVRASKSYSCPMPPVNFLESAFQ